MKRIAFMTAILTATVFERRNVRDEWSPAVKASHLHWFSVWIAIAATTAIFTATALNVRYVSEEPIAAMMASPQLLFVLCLLVAALTAIFACRPAWRYEEFSTAYQTFT